MGKKYVESSKLVDKKIDFVSELNKRNITILNKDNEGNDLTGSIFEVIDNNSPYSPTNPSTNSTTNPSTNSTTNPSTNSTTYPSTN